MESRVIKTDEMGCVQPETGHGETAVIYEQAVNHKGCGGVSHWHTEAQFSLVTKGSVIFRTEDGEHYLEEGQSIFFNSGAVHEAEPGGPRQENKYLCVKFSPSAVLGQIDPYIKSNFVDTVVYTKQLKTVLFAEGLKAQRVSKLLVKLTSAYLKKNLGYELTLRILLMQLWQIVFETVSPVLNDISGNSYSDQQRGEILQAYMRQNYMEKITLDDISRAANISRGECCRVFKRLYHTTPFQYLIHFRLVQSLPFLCESDTSISEIAQQVGFGSSSYYTECFKKEMHCTPLKYRQNYQRGKYKMQCVI